MNQIEQLHAAIEETFDGAIVTVTPPLRESGVWFMDVTFEGRKLVVEWSSAADFGVSSISDQSYGERPDESYASLDEVRRRVTELLTSNESTIPPIGVELGRLRELRGCTQEELASKLGVKQASVSGMEGRQDVQISTIRRVIKALSGSLEVCAVFSDARFRLCPTWTDLSSDIRSPFIESVDAEFSELVHGASRVRVSDNSEMFPSLHACGMLPQAMEVTRQVTMRRMVLEMGDA